MVTIIRLYLNRMGAHYIIIIVWFLIALQSRTIETAVKMYAAIARKKNDGHCVVVLYIVYILLYHIKV